MCVELRTLKTGIHSGSFGGAAPDALTALCGLLATLHDEHGDVAVAGLGNGAVPAFAYPDAKFRAEAGVLALDATPVTKASNTLTPMARAKVGLRVAPDGEAGRAGAALAEHLRAHAPWGAQVSVTVTELAQPHRVDTSGWQFAAAGRAYRNAYGREVVHIGSGGSIPFVAEFAAAFPSAAILIASAGADNDSHAHGTDESVHLAEFERACLAKALLIEELGSESSQRAFAS